VAGKPFDPTLKDLVETNPADWVALANLPRATTHVIDADIATVSGAGDKVLRVETDPPYLLHLEFLAGHDAADQPRLLHKRNLLLEDRHDLDVQTVAVVLRPEADSPHLNEFRSRTFRGATKPYMTFTYHVCRAWQLPVEKLLRGGPGTLPLAPISAVAERDLPDIIKEMDARLQRRRLRSLAPKLWAATYILMGMRYAPELIDVLFRRITSMKESSTYQAILREGMNEGRAQGMAEGAVAELKKVILLQGTNRFGDPGTQSRAELEKIDDLERLEQMSLYLLQAAGWNELLERSAPRRRNGHRRQST
jgi:predicted transposase YdaD